MKHYQIILILSLIWVVFINQVLAFNHSVATDETDELIKSISVGIVKVTEFSR